MSQRYFEDFSHVARYAKYRPRPAPEIGEKILAFLKEKYSGSLEVCVDVGCGNGQCINLFSPHFAKMLGTDISPGQIEFAKTLNHPSNVEFKVSPAESIPLPDNSVQLINSGQACHWFDLPSFFKDADRVLSKNGVVALFGYSDPQFIHPQKDELKNILHHFEYEEFADCWGPGVKLWMNEYSDIKIPYSETVRMDVWSKPSKITLQALTDYVSSWSGYQNYKKRHGEEAGNQLLNKFVNSFRKVIGSDADPKDIVFDYNNKYFLLMGRKTN